MVVNTKNNKITISNAIIEPNNKFIDIYEFVKYVIEIVDSYDIGNDCYMVFNDDKIEISNTSNEEDLLNDYFSTDKYKI